MRIRLAPTLIVLAACAALCGAAASQAVAANCEPVIFDSGGYRFDFEVTALPGELAVNKPYGAIGHGGSEASGSTPKTLAAYDKWGNGYVFSATTTDFATATVEDKYLGPLDGCTLSADGRELAYPVVGIHGLEVQRRWFVDPGPLHGARILTVLRNPSPAPIAVTAVLGDPNEHGDLDSDGKTTAQATSDGSKAFSPNSSWGVTTDSSTFDEDPALAHVWDGVGGARRVSEVILSEDELRYAWKGISVAPGATVALISYEIQNAVIGRQTAAEVAGAVAQADAREKQSPASLYTGMSAAEIAGTLNWPRPTATAAIAPVMNANAARQVLLDGSASANTVADLPQCAPTYAWQVDDGATGSQSTLSHFFSPGRHRVELTATNSCGGSQTATTTFRVASGLKLGKVRRNARKGTATLKVRVLGAGRLKLSGKGLKARSSRVKKAGARTVLVKPAGKVKAKLASTGRAKVKVRVTLTPEGGKPSRATKAIVLRRD